MSFSNTLNGRGAELKVGAEKAQQYASMRRHVATIESTRYTVLAISMAATGTIMGLVTRGAGGAVVRWLPLAFGAVLLPSMLITYYLTVHFYRLVTLLEVAFEHPPLVPVEAGFREFKRLENESIPRRKVRIGLGYMAYRKPLIIAYGALAVAAGVFSFLANWQSPRAEHLEWLPVFLGVAVWWGLMCWIGYAIWVAGEGVKELKNRWIQALADVRAAQRAGEGK